MNEVKILSEFVGVRSKAYAYKYLTRGLNEFKCEKKLKGLKKSVLIETMNFQHYLECIWKRKDVYREMNLIRNYKHEIFSKTVSKKARTAFDDKRYIMSDGINTLPYGFKV